MFEPRVEGSFFFLICHANLSGWQVQKSVTESFLKCHTSPKTYTEQRKQMLKNDMSLSYLLRRFPAMNNVRQ